MRHPAAALVLAALAAAGAGAQEQEPAAEPAERPLGRGAAFDVLDAGPTVTVRAGTALRARPDAGSEVLTRIPTATVLPVLERYGDWVKTHHGDWAGWLAPDGETPAVAAPGESLRLSPLVVDTSVAQRALRVGEARAALGRENAAATTLGPWPLHTDVTDAALLARLQRVAAVLPTIYAERFGLEPVLDQPAAVLLFAREAAYREFTDRHTDVGELHGGGHANDAMAALYAQGRIDDVASALVHELTHLLNRRRFAPPPPTWLEEGLANDLGLSRLRADGGLELGSLTGQATTVTQRSPFAPRRVTVDTTITGGQGTWIGFLRTWRERDAGLPRLQAVLGMEWVEFVAPEQRAWNYAQSTFFVRYLLDHAPEAWAERFRGFLRAAAGGAPSDGAALAAALGATPAHVQREFERWLTSTVVHSR